MAPSFVDAPLSVAVSLWAAEVADVSIVGGKLALEEDRLALLMRLARDKKKGTRVGGGVMRRERTTESQRR